MSRARRSLKLAVRDMLRANGWANSDCEIVAPPGKPHPRAGEYFVGVTDAGRTFEHWDAIYAQMGVQVIVTVRGVYAGADREDPGVVTAADGLSDKAAAICVLLQNNRYDVLARANAYLDAGPTGPDHTGFLEPPILVSESAPEPVTGDWFEAGAQSKAGGRDVAGYKVVIQYGKALLAQAGGLEATA